MNMARMGRLLNEGFGQDMGRDGAGQEGKGEKRGVRRQNSGDRRKTKTKDFLAKSAKDAKEKMKKGGSGF
jgi:hypothetical protein